MEPPGPPPHPQMFEDAEHLKLLSVFYYISAGLTALAGFFPALYIFMGGFLVGGGFPAASSSGPPPPPWLGWVFIGGGLVLMLFIWAIAAAWYLAGKWISERRNWTFCFVMACVSCVNVPLGTALGVFTIVVLQRPSVRVLFGNPRIP